VADAYAWNWNPVVGAMLALAGWRYMDGVWRYWRRVGSGRGVSHWQVMMFWAGLLVMFVALISPLDALSERLLSAHMLQHLLLMLVAPPLLVAGAPPLALINAVPRRWRRQLARWWNRQHFLHHLSEPFTVWVIFGLTLWVWHIPAFYQAALHDPAIHILEHLSFSGAALLFWWVYLREVHQGLATLALFTTAVHSSILGALMTFSATAWYPVYDATVAWGLTALEDQQIAGLIMWIPGGVIYVIAALVLLGHWLQQMEDGRL
jgi:putative membrane protein